MVRSRPEASSRADSAVGRVAGLAAGGRPTQVLFDAVTIEASALTGSMAAMGRFEDDRTEVVVVSRTDGALPLGFRFAVDGDIISARVARSGRPERIDDYAALAEAGFVTDHGLVAGVAVPVVVGGDLWGLLAVASSAGPLPSGTEDRLSLFAEIVAAAIAGAEARDDLRGLADEQAALLRVAALVAGGVSGTDLFHAVTREAAALVDDEATTLVRYEGDRTFTVLAQHNGPASVGLRYRVPEDDEGTSAQVLRTLEPARLDDHASVAARSYSLRDFDVASSVTIPVIVEGRLWGCLGTLTEGRRLPSGTEARLLKFAELVTVAIANAENREKLRASRARVVATADETRHRLQRDVHDGAQQRLVQTVLTLRLALDAAAHGEDVAGLVGEALAHAERATTELRDVVHGILPASVTRGGLRAGLETLIADQTVPVHLDMDRYPTERPPRDVEVTAYFVVTEALTNVVKHARACAAHVAVVADAGRLIVEISDDGVGGATLEGGSGLVGLTDRVEAVDGSIVVTSPAGRGTTLRVTLPLPRRGPGSAAGSG